MSTKCLYHADIQVNDYTACLCIYDDSSLCTYSSKSMLTIGPENIALPLSLIGQNDEGDLLFTTFVQINESFLLKEQLNSAIMVNGYTT